MKNKPKRVTKKFRKGDRVIAIAGNDRGRIGIVQSCREDKIIVQGLNVRKKHIKKSEQAPNGRIVEIERPFHISNVKICIDENTATNKGA